MNGDAIMSCTDQVLQEQMDLHAFGDLLAVRNFAMQHSISNSSDIEEKKLELVYAVKGQYPKTDSKTMKIKRTRLVHLGWQNFNDKKRKYTAVKKCGGSRQLEIHKEATKKEIIEMATNIFFPGGKSHLGSLALFNCDLGNFGCDSIADGSCEDTESTCFTLESYIKSNKLSHVRLYLLTKKRALKDLLNTIASDDDSDFEHDKLTSNPRSINTDGSSSISSCTDTWQVCKTCSQEYLYFCFNCSNDMQDDNIDTFIEEQSSTNSRTEQHLICSNCGCTKELNGCLRCLQDAEFKRTQQIDCARDHLLELSKEFCDEATPPSLAHIRSARLARFRSRPMRYRHSIGSPSLMCSDKKDSDSADSKSHIFGDDEVERYFDTELELPKDSMVLDDEAENENKLLLKTVLEEYENSLNQYSDRTVIVQRAKEMFWSVLFRQKLDLSRHRVLVRFAGEAGADGGGPYREFLTLTMSRFNQLKYMFFGGDEKLCFSAHAESIVERKYFMLGQLTAVSILKIGRGPECIHPGVVRAMYDINQVQEFESVDDEVFKLKLQEIEDGNHDVLYDIDISPYGKTMHELKSLFTYAYVIMRRFAAIDQFKAGIGSISELLICPNHYQTVKTYLECRHAQYSFTDVISLFSYTQRDEFENGSNAWHKLQGSVTEFEVFLSNIESKSIKIDVKAVTFEDLLLFCTGTDRIPPYGFEKAIEIEFHDVSLPSCSTCGLHVVVPYTDIESKFVMALNYGGGFGSI